MLLSAAGLLRDKRITTAITIIGIRIIKKKERKESGDLQSEKRAERKGLLCGGTQRDSICM